MSSESEEALPAPPAELLTLGAIAESEFSSALTALESHFAERIETPDGLAAIIGDPRLGRRAELPPHHGCQRNRPRTMSDASLLDAYPSEDVVRPKVNPTRVDLIRKVMAVEVPAALVDRFDAPPNSRCRELAQDVVIALWNFDHLRPKKISASTIGGIMIVYWDESCGLRMEIEVDNEGDITGVIASSSAILQSDLVTPPAEWSDLVRDYHRRIAEASSL